jgi:3-oxoacyl-[acyl-carrier protein] reductase
MRRIAAITGGAGGIGGAIASRLSAAGYEVALLDRAEAFAAQSPEMRDGQTAFSVDLAEQAATISAAHEILARHGRCDVLVHAAASFARASLDHLDLATWREVQAVNVESALWLAQALSPQMAARGFGRIILIGSDTVWDPPPAPDLLPYIASKAALIGVTRALARAIGAGGITVNCVAPGLTSTPSAQAGMSAEQFDAVRQRQSVPRTLVPEDVAAVVAFLASDEAGAISGQTLNVDGGLVLR